MSIEIDPIYFVYLLVAGSAGLLAEGAYLLVYSGASYRQNVNRRLKLLRTSPTARTSCCSCAESAGSRAPAITGSASRRSTGWCCNPG